MAGTKPAKTKGVGVGKGKRAPLPSYKTIAVDVRNAVARVTLARPDVHNAFNETLIAEMTQALSRLDSDAAVRAVVLLGEGRSFCAGADLNWMKRMAGYGRAENLADARTLATMLETLHRMGKPTIARVHGPDFGGGVGLVACCDIVVAAPEATFSLSEVKLGLIPATIGPYVVEAIGARQARRYFLSAERFTAAEALRIGLVHEIVPQDELDARINDLLDALLAAGPRAQGEAKALIRAIAHRPIGDDVIEGTVLRIAAVRASAEGKEGVAAFLEKREPSWLPATLRKPRKR
jgi:methylglutaconyl-CoA hydratase